MARRTSRLIIRKYKDNTCTEEILYRIIKILLRIKEGGRSPENP